MNILINNLERDITCLQATSEATKQKIRLIKEHVSLLRSRFEARHATLLHKKISHQSLVS